MRITISYPSGHVRTYKDLTQKQVNTLINTINHHQDLMPLDFVHIKVDAE